MRADNTPNSGETHRAEPANAKLGARLLCAAALVERGRAAADIGCDHGKLAVWLALHGSPSVVAVDSRPLPLAGARRLALQSGCADRVHCRLGGGLEPLARMEAAEIVIAGLSGETTADILRACAWIRSPEVHLVLLPSTRAEALRRMLCREGFAVEGESAVAENGRYYACISARYRGGGFEPSELFCQVGLLAGGGDAARGYIRARLRNLRNRLRAPVRGEERRRRERLLEEVAACLRRER